MSESAPIMTHPLCWEEEKVFGAEEAEPNPKRVKGDLEEEMVNREEQARTSFSRLSSLDLERLEFSESREAELAQQEQKYRVFPDED